MNSIRQQLTHFFSTFSLNSFLLLSFGLPFLAEGLFLFLRQSFLNNSYHSFYRLLFFALLFLYSLVFNQLQTHETFQKNFSLASVFISFIFWLLLSPIFFFRFYQLFLVWQPLPAQILSFLFLYRWKVLPAIILLYLIILYLLYRSILTPRYLKEGHPLKTGIQLSWAKTKNSVIKHVIFFLILPAAFLLTNFLLKGAFIAATQILTGSVTAMLLLLLHRVLQNMLWALFFLYLLAADKKRRITTSRTKISSTWLSLMILTCLSLYFFHYEAIYHTQRATEPLTISHRGVTNRNGLQNSLAALKKTHTTSQPDFIEMDVQETVDHQLVVIHDEDLKTLAHKNLRIDETTWSELKEISLKENGYTSKISLFSDYLAAANRLNQRLLIELKVTAKTKKTIVQRLLPFKNQLTDHQLQSMDLNTANQMKKNFPIIKVGYILPFNLLGSPKTTLDFINIEAQTTHSDLIQYLRQQKQEIYVWSIDSKQQAAAFHFQRVHGLLSDDLSMLSAVPDDIRSRTASILYFD